MVTWCLGHLVELDEPAAYNPAWKRWSLDTLPMLPDRFRLRPVRSSAAQWKVVRDLLRDRSFTEVVNGCDAGREGELIFRLCYELSGSKLPVRRLWISSMTDGALRAGLAGLRPGARYDALADAARCRSEADWLVGMNATRAVTTRNRGGDNTLYSIGRVQTPTLALVVAREQAVRTFVPRDYWEVHGTFARPGDAQRFRARWSHAGRSRLATEALAEAITARAGSHREPPAGPRVETVEARAQKVPPPLLFDLTSLQRTANRRWGLSAQRTLDIAQALYETHKLLTYPRTDSRHLTGDLRGELPEVFDALAADGAYAPFARQLRAHPPGPTPRVFNDARVSDHHAIIPTTRKADSARLDRDEARIHDLVVRRFLGAFYPDAEFLLTTAVVVVGETRPGDRAPAPPPVTPPPRTGDSSDADTDVAELALGAAAFLDAVPPPPDRFIARGRARVKAGWQEVAGVGGAEADGDTDDLQDLPRLTRGDVLSAVYAHARKQTLAPRRYTEATLLSAMESAGRAIEDDALRLAMKDTGLGTPATRAATIETLLRRGYVIRQQKNLVSTALGEGLIAGLPVPSLASPELTGAWEARLARMARGEERREDFMRDIAGYVRALVDGVRAAPARVVAATAAANAAGAASGSAPDADRESGPGDTRARARPGAAPRARARSTSGAARGTAAGTAATGRAKPVVETAEVPGATTELTCPRCRQGRLITGRRAWGCSRWREGCTLVVPFEPDGRRITSAQLRDLVTRGVTRATTWQQDGATVRGRLRLDLTVEPPAVRVEATGTDPGVGKAAAPATRVRRRGGAGGTSGV